MYISKINLPPDHFSLSSFIQENGFATLVSTLDFSPTASHIPLYYLKDEKTSYLYGHVAKGNEIVKALEQNNQFLAIFMNSHAYVSSSWYDHVNVPTWNYIAAHVYGKAEIVAGTELVDSINLLVEQYESGRSDRFSTDQMNDKDFLRQLRGIVGFKIRIEKTEVSFKLSQNRNKKDYNNIIANLDQGTEMEKMIAKKMKLNRKI